MLTHMLTTFMIIHIFNFSYSYEFLIIKWYFIVILIYISPITMRLSTFSYVYFPFAYPLL